MEQDPNGISAHEPGAKLDAGKTRVGLVLGGFSRALSAVCEVGTYGAQKYTPNGWRSVPDGVERYTDAMGRHLLREPQETTDPDSGLSHAAHVAWNALARLELMIREEEWARAKAPVRKLEGTDLPSPKGLDIIENTHKNGINEGKIYYTWRIEYDKDQDETQKWDILATDEDHARVIAKCLFPKVDVVKLYKLNIPPIHKHS